MQNMQRGWHPRDAIILPVQMLGEYQACAPTVLDGMALAFPEEALRTLQDTFSIHQALFCEYATDPTYKDLHPALPSSYRTNSSDMVKILPRDYSLARMSSLGH